MSSPKTPEVKICGLSTPETLDAAARSGARFVGFVFYPPSPRHVLLDIAANLARSVPTGLRSVGLFVDPDDEQLEQIIGGVQIDMIQLHGNETPKRVAEIKNKYNMPVIKAIRIGTTQDLQSIDAFEEIADWLLFDSKPHDADLPGGTGQSFEWKLLKGRDFKRPWMLSGGLTQNNVSDALLHLHPDAVDVSSGVESAKGIKDVNKIKDFIKAVKSND